MRLIANVDVDDLDVGVRFYCDGLGLVARRWLFDDTAVELAGAGVPVYLLPAGAPPFPSATAGRDYARHWTPVHLDLVVPDLEAAVTRAVAAGGALEGAIQGHDWGRMATLRDPFGHGVCLLDRWQVGRTGVPPDPTHP